MGFDKVQICRLSMARKDPTHNKASVNSSGTDSSPFFRQLVVSIIVFLLVYSVYALNADQDRLPQLMQEFNRLQQQGPQANMARMQELYNEIIGIQNDTSFFKRITKGYRWAVHDMAMGSYEQIKDIENRVASGQMKPLSLDDKRAYKISTYSYLKYLNENTPDTAVILLPPYSVTGDRSQYNFLHSSEWVEYFIYPRMCISEDARDVFPDIYKRVTHVAVVDSWGYHKLRYPVQSMAREAVFPINRP